MAIFLFTFVQLPLTKYGHKVARNLALTPRPSLFPYFLSKITAEEIFFFLSLMHRSRKTKINIHDFPLLDYLFLNDTFCCDRFWNNFLSRSASTISVLETKKGDFSFCLFFEVCHCSRSYERIVEPGGRRSGCRRLLVKRVHERLRREGLQVEVGDPVAAHVALLREPLLADVARVGLLARVDSAVVDHVALRRRPEHAYSAKVDPSALDRPPAPDKLVHPVDWVLVVAVDEDWKIKKHN